MTDGAALLMLQAEFLNASLRFCTSAHLVCMCTQRNTHCHHTTHTLTAPKYLVHLEYLTSFDVTRPGHILFPILGTSFLFFLDCSAPVHLKNLLKDPL